jgi:hypothetical protein
MEEKLKSILKRTHWSSLLKAVAFGAAWWLFPFWLFLLIALYLYFVPFSGTAKIAVPFFVLLVISFFEGQNIIWAVIFAAIFYFVMLIRDLLIIDRKSAYEILVLILSYLLIRNFFLKVGGDFGGFSLIYSFFIAVLFGGMLSSYMNNFSITDSEPEARSFRRTVSGVFFILMWQLLIVGLFLPLDFIYQSAVVFLVAAIFIDVVPHYIFGEMSRKKVLATSTVLFALLTIVLASARWTL